MRALVISGGGSKGAYAGGVAEHLIRIQKKKYDLFVGTSTGSLLLTHLALGKIDKLHRLYTEVNQKSIFNRNPFVIKKKGNREYVGINYFNTLLQFIKRKRTFGESENLKKLINSNLLKEEFERARIETSDIVIAVSNLTKGVVEYKSIQQCSYEEFCDWIWISCNFVPFMSLATRMGNEYADGGFGALVPIREAIRRGATQVDAIILKSESLDRRQVLGKNPFSLMMSLFQFMSNQIESNNVIEADLVAQLENVEINMYYTPSKLIENSLIFDQTLMKNWWKQGFEYASKRVVEKQDPTIVQKWIEFLKSKNPFS